MKILTSYLFLVFYTFVLSAQTNHEVFTTDVKTEKKPWTNLYFNNDPNNFQFAIMADRTGGMRPGIFIEAVEKINTIMPEFVISIGDLIPGYTTDTAQISKEWKDVNEIISGLKMPFFYLPGNHDITNKVMEKEWEKRYGRRYYNFTYKNTLFITLDSNDDEDFNLSRKQTDFVLNSLKENTDVRWTFLFMHHPIWTYDTGGLFEEIEEALKERTYSVIAGHAHRYHQTERNGSNYYILSTTGGGNSLIGDNFGLFDHISWVTLSNEGPIMANLKLDGILPHNITNDYTLKLANPMLANARLNHMMLCNTGKNFKHGTLYFSFKNPTEEDLLIDLNFFHHHQLQFKNTDAQIVVKAGEDKIIEIPFSTSKPTNYNLIDPLRLDWEMKYLVSTSSDFKRQGKYLIPIEPKKSEFITNNINTFLEKETVDYNNQFPKLEAWYKQGNSSEKKYNHSIEFTETSEFSFFLKNSKNEYSSKESRIFEKTTFQESSEVTTPEPGLIYEYYEGEWETMPDFNKLQSKSKGVTNDFMVRDIALREDNWGLVYTGYIKITEDNLYLFRVRFEEDVASFYIDNKLVVGENTEIKGENVGAAALKKGYHQIRIEFWEKQDGQRLRFYTKTSGERDWNFMEFDPFFH